MTHLVTTRTPLRIGLFGGGTDLPFYYSKNGGYLITAAIDQYLHVNVAERKLDDKIFLQYSTFITFTINNPVCLKCLIP